MPRRPIVTRHGGSVPKANLALTPTQKRAAQTMTSRQAKIQEDTHFRIMRILQDNPDLTQRELADKLGMSVGGLNYCLNALIDKGFVKMANFSKSKNKFKYVYLLTPQGIAEKVALTSRFLKRKMEEYDALKVEIEALKAEVGEDQGDILRKQAQ
jgi:EPS-associated MarR family transcriptional regulator